MLLHGVGPCTADLPQWFQAVLKDNQLGDQFLPVPCQQQSSFNCNRRVYPPHTGREQGGDAHLVPSWGDRETCAAEPYRTPTALGHYTKPGRHNSCTWYIETNTGRLQKWKGKGMYPNERTKQNSRKTTKQSVDKQSTRCRVQNCGSWSRPDRFMVCGQTEEYSRSRWDVWRAFIHVWESNALCKLCVPLRVSACHTSWPLLPERHPAGSP